MLNVKVTKYVFTANVGKQPVSVLGRITKMPGGICYCISLSLLENIINERICSKKNRSPLEDEVHRS